MKRPEPSRVGLRDNDRRPGCVIQVVLRIARRHEGRGGSVERRAEDATDWTYPLVTWDLTGETRVIAEGILAAAG